MKRIAFLDYVRVFACFLVMLVHASENYYGAVGSTDMVGPQAFLQNEADRLWVSIYDGFSRMSVPLFMIVSAYLLAPMKKGQSCWEFYRKRFLRIMPPFIFFMVLYSTLPMLWGQIDGEQSMNDLSRIWLNFPMLAGHFWFMYPLIGLYLFIPVISPCWRRFRRKKNVSSSDCSWFLLAYLSSTVGLVRCGDSASGTNITCYGISRVIWATLCWHIISACILLGGVPCVCGSVSCLCWSGRWLPYGRSMSRLFREWFILRRSLRWDGLSAP